MVLVVGQVWGLHPTEGGSLMFSMGGSLVVEAWSSMNPQGVWEWTFATFDGEAHTLKASSVRDLEIRQALRQNGLRGDFNYTARVWHFS